MAGYIANPVLSANNYFMPLIASMAVQHLLNMQIGIQLRLWRRGTVLPILSLLATALMEIATVF